MFFLSHAGSDAASALALATGLKNAGLDVWCDQRPRAMEAGKPFTEQLEHKLRDSTAFLLLVGKRGVDRWVRAEVDVALNRQVKDPSYRIVPLLLAGTTAERLPPFLARFHALSLDGDVTRWGRTEFQSLAEHVRSFASRLAVDPDTCPFPGLESFGRKEARFFFGRDPELREALTKLGREKGVYRRWLAVEGASGSGKSSFVKAGLVPAIRGGWVEGAPRRWRVAEMRPGKNAIHQLARALVRAFRKKDAPPDRVTRVEEALRHETGLRDFIALELKEGWGLLLVLDQLEEVFTLSEGSPDESRHLEALLVRALEGDSPLHLLTTIRSDFLGHMSERPLLSKALNARWTSRYLLGPMNEQGLREAILAPAQMAGVSFEEELSERILKDTRESTRVAGEALPLVAHVLLELWKRRSKQVLTHAAYGELGGVGGALTQSADALLNTFTEEEQELVSKLMLSLVKVGRGEQDVRRTLKLDEAVRAVGGGEKGRGILARLSGGRAPDEPMGSPAPPRLLSVSAERVDLVHEALLSKWQTLQGWLKTSREVLERQDDLEAAAKLWKATGALPSAAQLDYLKSSEPVSHLAREFLEAGRHVTLARELVTHAQGRPAKNEPQLSLRLLLEAWRLDPSEQTATALLDWYQGSPRLRLSGHSRALRTVCFSPNGRRVLTASEDDTARLWDAASGQLLAQFLGHSDSVSAACFSPDGQHVLTASHDNTARLWDASSGKPLAQFLGHSDSVSAACFSPDGQHVLTASHDGTARLWDASSGKPLTHFLGHSDWVHAACFSPDGQHVLTASYDGTACLWDASSGRPLADFLGHSDWVSAACFSPDGQRVLTASHDNTARLWDASSGKLLAQLLGHSDLVSAACFSPDGQHVLTASADKTARLWDASSGKPLTQFLGHSESVSAAYFSPDGRRVLTASDDNTACLWDAFSGKLLAEFLGHSDMVSAACFSPDGQRVLTASADKTVRLWNASSGRPLAQFLGHSDWVSAACFSPNGQRVLTASHDKTARLWDASSGRPLTQFLEHTNLVSAACFSPDGQRVLTVSHDHTAYLWDASSGRLLTEFLGHSDSVRAACFSPDGQRVLTASADKTARLWDASSGKPLTHFLGHSDLVSAACFSPDGQRVLTASADKTARLWDASSGKPLTHFLGHSDLVSAACFSPDGQRVLTASADKTARLWDASSGKSLTHFLGHSDSVRAACFSPDGRRVLTVSDDHTAHLWEASSSKLLAQFLGHSDWVSAACFSPDGRRVLTASHDNTVRLWDASSGKPLAEFVGHFGWVNGACFSPDGRGVLTASDDTTARLWWVHELCAPVEELVELAQTMARELSEEERRLYLGAV